MGVASHPNPVRQGPHRRGDSTMAVVEANHIPDTATCPPRWSPTSAQNRARRRESRRASTPPREEPRRLRVPLGPPRSGGSAREPGAEPGPRAGAHPLRAHAGLALHLLPRCRARSWRRTSRGPRGLVSTPRSAATPTSPISASSVPPERQIVFDCNDFDETLPGPWEWDVKAVGRQHRGGGAVGRGFSRAPADLESIQALGLAYRQSHASHGRPDEPRGLVLATSTSRPDPDPAQGTGPTEQGSKDVQHMAATPSTRSWPRP